VPEKHKVDAKKLKESINRFKIENKNSKLKAENSFSKISNKIDNVNNKQEIKKHLKYSGRLFPKSLGKDPIDYDDQLSKDVQDLIIETLEISKSDMDMSKKLMKLGMESILSTEMITKLNNRYKLKLAPTMIFNQDTGKKIVEFILKNYAAEIKLYYDQKMNIESIMTVDHAVEEGNHRIASEGDRILQESVIAKQSDYVEKTNKLQEKVFKSEYSIENKIINYDYKPIAVIGISGKFPKSESIEELWGHLIKGNELISDFQDKRWGDYFNKYNGIKFKKIRAGIISDADRFDSNFFEIAPADAEIMDPRQRLVLEAVWKTIEDAGYKASQLEGTNTGVFIGIENNEYEKFGDSSQCMIANRISYFLDINGASEVVDTSCTSSLVAIHRAVKAIQGKESEFSVAAGVSVLYSPKRLIQLFDEGMLSENGKGKSFDDDAKGLILGEGVGAVLLKPLDKAMRDKDHIYGIIKGSAVMHGGRVSSIEAPSPNIQSEVAKETFNLSNVSPDTVTYAELHGVGNQLADAAEVEGIVKAFSNVKKENNCMISCLTPNIGNLEPASGIAGFFKILMAFKYKAIPPVINFNKINRYINLDESSFYIGTKTEKWNPKTSIKTR